MEKENKIQEQQTPEITSSGQTEEKAEEQKEESDASEDSEQQN